MTTTPVEFDGLLSRGSSEKQVELRGPCPASVVAVLDAVSLAKGITRTDLDRIGVAAKEWALVGLNGNDIYSEPRGVLAGYNWPQYAVHRGHFHMLLYDKPLPNNPNTVDGNLAPTK